ncbi:hypothetical protein Tco_0537771, partial [Tanacetum coccineum]
MTAIDRWSDDGSCDDVGDSWFGTRLQVRMEARGLFGWLKRLGGWLGTPEPTKNNLDADMASSDWWIWNMTAANDK